MNNVQFGSHRSIWPGPSLGELRDCNAVLADRDALTAQFDTDGYLLIRGLLDRQDVLDARAHIATHLHDAGAIEEAHPTGALIGVAGSTLPYLAGDQHITHHPTVVRVLASTELDAFYNTFFAEPATTFDFKWLRAVENGRFTGAHCDSVYMGRGSQRLMTAWIPLGDITPRLGSLAICVGSHNDDRYGPLRDTYGRSDVDRDNTPGWFTDDPLSVTREFGGRWSTANFAAGDVITFGMNTMHASTTNITNEVRISCDVRYQPTADPADNRWMGAQPAGHVTHTTPPQPIDDARKQWGLA